MEVPTLESFPKRTQLVVLGDLGFWKLSHSTYVFACVRYRVTGIKSALPSMRKREADNIKNLIGWNSRTRGNVQIGQNMKMELFTNKHKTQEIRVILSGVYISVVPRLITDGKLVIFSPEPGVFTGVGVSSVVHPVQEHCRKVGNTMA